MTATKNSWISRSKRNPQARLRLFGFPYAGGGALAYRGWQDRVLAEVEFCPVQIPGRETRITEKAYHQFPALIEAAIDGLQPYLDMPFALFGHSMGATLAFEMARRLDRTEHKLVRLFVSGTGAPQVPTQEPVIYDLPDAEFLRRLTLFEGIPSAALAQPELMELMLPTLKADFTAIQTYKYVDGPRLQVPVSAFGGEDDPYVSAATLHAWKEQTTSSFEVHMFPGGHFYFASARDFLLARINESLRPFVTSARS